MTRGLVLLVLGALAPMIQGVAGTFVHPAHCPDLSLLLAIGLGLHWRSKLGGVALACLLGFFADLLSGSLLGQHALLRMFAFGAARLCSRKMNLRGAVPLVLVATALSVVDSIGGALLSAFFASAPGVDWVWVRDLVVHALITGAFAPLVHRASIWRGDDATGRHILPLQPRHRLS